MSEAHCHEWDEEFRCTICDRNAIWAYERAEAERDELRTALRDLRTHHQDDGRAAPGNPAQCGVDGDGGTGAALNRSPSAVRGVPADAGSRAETVCVDAGAEAMSSRGWRGGDGVTRWRTEAVLDASPRFRDEWEREMVRQGWVKVVPCAGKCACHCHKIPKTRFLSDPYREVTGP